jgi:shikimate dehydrogenase
VVNEGGVLVGHNTDGVGWSRALREAFGRGPGEVRILILGAGGAARAIAGQALAEGCPRLLLANRNIGRAEQLASDLKSIETPAAPVLVNWSEKELAAALVEVDLVVNATSAGLKKDDLPILKAAIIPKGLLIYDTLYGPAADKLRAEAETAGAEWSDGLGMLLHQGAAAFSLWSGREAPLEVMRAALASAFSASRA